jgi:nicotinate-nucleotide adenylyltransferase
VKTRIKTIVFGGTFDPIHCGHIGMVEKLLEEVTVEQILIVPNTQSPHKPRPIATDEHRLALLNKALPQFPLYGQIQYDISLIELNRKGVSYMSDTIIHFFKEQQYSKIGSRLGLLMGGDSFLSFHHWRQYQKIQEKVILLVVPRHAISRSVYRSYQEENKLNDVHILSSGTVDISASQIRDQHCLTGIKGVDHYIQEKRVYQ